MATVAAPSTTASRRPPPSRTDAVARVAFGDGFAWRPGTDSPCAVAVRDRIDAMWSGTGGGSSEAGFAGSLAVSMMRADMPHVASGRYVVLTKSDGTRYMLGAFDAAAAPHVANRGSPACRTVVMLDRGLAVHLVGVRLPECAFAGTVLDGELVRFYDAAHTDPDSDPNTNHTHTHTHNPNPNHNTDPNSDTDPACGSDPTTRHNPDSDPGASCVAACAPDPARGLRGRHVYQVFDAMVLAGVRVAELPFERRLELARVLLASCEADDDDGGGGDGPFLVRVKAPSDADEAYRILTAGDAALPHPADGVMLAEAHAAYRVGRHPLLLKYKLPERHTVDLRIVLRPPERAGDPPTAADACATERARLVSCCVVTDADVAACALLPDAVRHLDGQIVEFRWDGVRGRWAPAHVRRDKALPNSVETFLRTRRNIEEDIRPDELRALLLQSAARHPPRAPPPTVSAHGASEGAGAGVREPRTSAEAGVREAGTSADEAMPCGPRPRAKRMRTAT